MSNTTTGGYETNIAMKIQKFLDRTALYSRLASFGQSKNMTRGRSVNRPIFTPSLLTLNDYTALTDTTPQDWTYTAEDMTVNFEKECTVALDPFEEMNLQVPGVQALLAQRLRYTMVTGLDRDFFDEVDNAGLDVDDGDFGGTSGNPIDVDSRGAEKVWGKAFAELEGNSIGELGLYTVIDPWIKDDIENRGIATTFNLSDKFFLKKLLNQFKGFDVFVSNSLPCTNVLTYTGTGTDSVDFKLDGVTFHQVTTIGTTAGNVLMATNATTSALNVKNFINATSTTSANQVALSVANQNKLKNKGIAATVAAGVCTITSYGRLQPLYTSTDANASFADEIVKVMCAQYGAIDMVTQIAPTIQINKAQLNAGHYLLGIVRAATKTFADGAQRLLKISVKG